ncbi:hypothetical protein PO124_15305 [Bacillus licheniformis]|nr:hypothetical protein [Bacillus licheniformis]
MKCKAAAAAVFLSHVKIHLISLLISRMPPFSIRASAGSKISAAPCTMIKQPVLERKSSSRPINHQRHDDKTKQFLLSARLRSCLNRAKR